MHRLIIIFCLFALAFTATTAYAVPDADVNIGVVSISGGEGAPEGYYQEWTYSVQPNKYITCIGYYALGATTFTKKPVFTGTADGDISGWGTYISPDRKAVFLFGPRSHFGVDPSSQYTISYKIFYYISPSSVDAVVWDGDEQKAAWSRSGVPGNESAGFWSYSPALIGGPYSPNSTNFFNFQISGAVNSPPGGAFTGQIMQVGPAIFGDHPGDWGEINSYTASPGLPQVSSDLDKYGWGMYGTIDYFDGASRTHVSTGNWQIYYKNITDWPIEQGTYIIKTCWENGWDQPAKVTGKFNAEPGSTVVSPPWPVNYVDWASMGSASFSGVFTNPDQLAGSFNASDNKLVLAHASGDEILYVRSGKPVNLNLYQEQMSVPAVGYQAFLSFDPEYLTFSNGTYTPVPYGLAIVDIAAAGDKINLASGVNPPIAQQPCAEDANLAALNFIAGAKEGITQVVFRQNNPPTRFSDNKGKEILTQTVDGPIIIVDNTPPTDLSLTVEPPTWFSSPATLIFSATDALSGVDRFELDLGGGESVVVTSPHVLDTSLFPTGMHEITITVYDKAGNSASTSTNIWIAGPPYINDIGVLKELDDDETFVMAGPIVTRVYENYFYLEDYNRSSGIRVNCEPEQMPEVGSTPMFGGTITTIDGERVVILGAIETFGPLVSVPQPLGMNTRATFVGLSPIGLLVKLAGRVTSISAQEGVFTLYDGAEVDIKVQLHDVPLPQVGSFVGVTGALGCDLSGPIVRVNSETDLQIWTN